MSNLYRFLLPEQRYCWVKVRILRETQKAVLVWLGSGQEWLPKSKIVKIRLENNHFEIYLKEGEVG